MPSVDSWCLLPNLVEYLVILESHIFALTEVVFSRRFFVLKVLILLPRGRENEIST